MSFLQGVVFWLMVSAMLSTFIDMEKARGKVDPKGGALQPVNRRLIDFSKLSQD